MRRSAPLRKASRALSNELGNSTARSNLSRRRRAACFHLRAKPRIGLRRERRGLLRVQISALAQGDSFERMAVGSKQALGERLLGEQGAHAFHLGVEVVQIVQ